MDRFVVSVEGLIKRYGSITAVDEVSFQVKKGEVFGLLGPNGAGKTTILECLEGMRQSDGGTLSVKGCDPQLNKRRLREILGVQLQASSLPEGIRPGEAMELICAWHGVSTRFDILNRFGIDSESKKQYRELSTGQKRRLHLAMALAGDPEVLILDEPTAGLDVEGRAQLHDSIRQLKAKGVTILLATHDMAEAESLCDRIAILIRGRIAAIGAPAEITSSGNVETKITLRTKRNYLLPGRDIGDARFINQTENYGVWLCRDTATAVMELLKEVQRCDDSVEDLRVERPSLEERFLELIQGGVKH
ncbi:MAG: ABC transporter ATP-binding protein [Clostridiaceae bacterium]|nr:ABC transporter ATP-binding protein [Clostridiaceae bacterium]